MTRRPRAIRAVLGEARKDKGIERAGNGHIGLRRRGCRRCMHVGEEERHRRLRREDELTRQQPVGHTTGRIEIRADVEVGAAQRLLRRDERRSSVNDVGNRQGSLCRRVWLLWPLVAFARPKSRIFTKSWSSPYRDRKMFAGLMSRWTRPQDSASDSE